MYHFSSFLYVFIYIIYLWWTVSFSIEYSNLNNNNNSPIDFLDDIQTPTKNRKVPTMKTINITTAYPSRPEIENGTGAGFGGSGFGHDASQSIHEHAGVFAY